MVIASQLFLSTDKWILVHVLVLYSSLELSAVAAAVSRHRKQARHEEKGEVCGEA